MSGKSIVEAKEHKVKDGESIKSIAEKNGLKWEDLAKFNWGTDDPDKINIFLRDKVGCRKKTEDGHNYIFSSNDDPGIIYIPKDIKALKFKTNSTHVVKVKRIIPKTFIPSECIVQIRPHAGWTGEFGFDWLRIGDRGPEKYEPPHLDGGYKAGVDAGLTPIEAKSEIKKEYETINIDIKDNPKYYIPYLNLFYKNVEGLGEPPYKAKLEIMIDIKAENAEAILLELPEYKDENGDMKPYFTVEPKDVVMPTAVGFHRKEITLTCLKEMPGMKQLKFIVHTKEKDGRFKSYVAGCLNVLPNSKKDRKKMKFVLIKVWSDSLGTGVKSKGTFTNTEKKNLKNALYQSLIIGEFVNGPDFDIGDNSDFKKPRFWGLYGGKFYSRDPSKPGLNQDHQEFYARVKSLFLKKSGNDKYKNDFLVFAFGERPYDKALGQVQDIGTHNLMVFPSRDECTLNHEALHGLGLLHSFKSVPVKPSAKFTFQEGKTDNVMDYTYDDSALVTWRWQWKIVN
jgi:hypothetical protein